MLRDLHLMVANLITIPADAPTARRALDAIRTACDRLGRPIYLGLAVMASTLLDSRVSVQRDGHFVFEDATANLTTENSS